MTLCGKASEKGRRDEHAYAGPVGVWLAVGISVFVIVSARAAVIAWRRRA